MGNVQWFGRVLIHIGDVGVFDLELIDVEGIKRVDGISPAFLLNRHVVLYFLRCLRQGDVQGRAADYGIADEDP